MCVICIIYFLMINMPGADLIKVDSIIFADNAIYPGCDELLVYLRNGVITITNIICKRCA